MVYRFEFRGWPFNGMLVYLVVNCETGRRHWHKVWVN